MLPETAQRVYDLLDFPKYDCPVSRLMQPFALLLSGQEGVSRH